MPGTWQALTHQPDFETSHLLLLTDGTVLCHAGEARWARLVPDENGEYVNGTWSSIDPMHHARRSFGAAVLADGRVLVVFGWPAATGTARDVWAGDITIEFFNPTALPTRQWSLQTASPDWGPEGIAPTHVCGLADGRRVLIGSDQQSLRSTLFDVTTGRWIPVDFSVRRDLAHHGWSLLPDGSVLSVNHFPTNFRYLPDTGRGRWVPAGHAVYEDVDVYDRSEGAGLLLPDGRVWVMSNFGLENFLFTPPTRLGETGSWTRGPQVPVADRRLRPVFTSLAGCLLPSGIVLVQGHWFGDGTLAFFEFDPFHPAGAVISQTAQPKINIDRFRPSHGFGGFMLLLPTGQALFSYESSMHIYTPDPDTRDPQPGWRPRLTLPSMGSRLTPGREQTATGTLFNGMSQAVYKNPLPQVGQGVSATNYPIIRLRHTASGRVWYCRTYGHSGMGVATGDARQSTRFVIPRSVPDGDAELCIIANGIVGDCVRVEIGPPLFEPIRYREAFQLIGNLADGPLIVFGPHGPVPVPPWGPQVDKAAFTERILNAYGQILFGLFSLEARGRMQDQQQPTTDEVAADDRLTALQQIEYGLAMLRKIGHELEGSLDVIP